MVPFLGLKIAKKWVLRELGFYFCLRFRCNFLGIPSFKILRFRKMFFFKFSCHRKMCRLCPSIPIFRGFFSLKSVKKMCMCVGVKIFALLLVKNVCFGVIMGISEFRC